MKDIDISLCVQELSLSGSISLGDASKSTVYRWTKKINSYLESGNYDWRVEVDPKTLIIQVKP